MKGYQSWFSRPIPLGMSLDPFLILSRIMAPWLIQVQPIDRNILLAHLFSKIEVNGHYIHPVFKFLKRNTPSLYDSALCEGKAIRDDFCKFLIAPNGIPVKFYSRNVPIEQIMADIGSLWNQYIQYLCSKHTRYLGPMRGSFSTFLRTAGSDRTSEGRSSLIEISGITTKLNSTDGVLLTWSSTSRIAEVGSSYLISWRKSLWNPRCPPYFTYKRQSSYFNTPERWKVSLNEGCLGFVIGIASFELRRRH